ncbi:hypothetical protein SAMN02745243_02667, partial [Hespellia stercorisuis DSM 15480]
EVEKVNRSKKNEPASEEDVRVCSICGRTIIGGYEYIRTRRKTEMYFCKGMRCRKEK